MPATALFVVGDVYGYPVEGEVLAAGEARVGETDDELAVVELRVRLGRTTAYT